MRTLCVRFLVILFWALAPACAAAAAGQVPAPAPTPRPPYRIGAVTIVHAGTSRTATLTVPEGPGPFPAVVLIGGSGNAGTLFTTLADHLTRKGVVVLRFDDAAVSGTPDSLAAAAHLAGMTTVDGRRVGLLGYAGGTETAIQAARTSKDIAFVVLAAGKADPGPVPVPVFTAPDPASRMSELAAWILATPRR
jgi:hypothetical protein